MKRFCNIGTKIEDSGVKFGDKLELTLYEECNYFEKYKLSTTMDMSGYCRFVRNSDRRGITIIGLVVSFSETELILTADDKNKEKSPYFYVGKECIYSFRALK